VREIGSSHRDMNSIKPVAQGDLPDGIGLQFNERVVVLVGRIGGVTVARERRVVEVPAVTVAVPACGERLPGIGQISKRRWSVVSLKVDLDADAFDGAG